MRTERIILSALFALPLVAVMGVDTSAQLRWPRTADYRYSEMDADRDRVITRAEWTGTRQAFTAADVNRDGVLSGDEVRLDATTGQAVGTSGTSASRRVEFQTFDRNRDGIVNRAEFTGSRAEFNAFDTDRDGVISAREYTGEEPQARRPRGGAPSIVDVDSRSGWVSTGLTVTQGQIVLFETSGTVQLSGDAADTAGAAGSFLGRRATGSYLPSELAGALVGRIGSSAPFGVGDLSQITAPASGELFLSVNDDQRRDNSGRFRVRVSSR